MKRLGEDHLYQRDGLPAPSTVAILPSALLRVVHVLFLDELRLHESTAEPLARLDGLRLQGRQEVREFVGGDVDPLGKLNEGEGLPCFGRAGADLDDGGVEVG